MTFAARLDACVEASGSLLCCGLDPDGFASAADAEHRCLEIVDATIDHVCAFKPNLAFFEQLGSDGYAILERLRARIPQIASSSSTPNVVTWATPRRRMRALSSMCSVPTA